MHINEVDIVDISHSSEWQVTYCTLMNVPPGTEVEDMPRGETPWDAFFVQDLLQVLSGSKKMLIDVGWYPERDSSGCFQLLLLRTISAAADWDNPLLTYETKSLDDLIAKVHELTR